MESSNALLKTLEEPGEKIHFFIIVSSVETIMPTLRSRLTIIDISSGKEEMEKELLEMVRKFLSSLPNKRLEIVKKYLRKMKTKMNYFQNRPPTSKKQSNF